MGAALALGERGRGVTWPNPNVGCVIVKDDRVVGRGWTQPGGRPHAEGMALAEAGGAATGATAFVTLEPCAHSSQRGLACAPSLAEAGIKRVVAALGDPDPRTCGRGFHELRAAGVIVIEGVRADDARRSMAGFLTRQHLGTPARHAEACPIARRQHRAGERREPLDYRGGCPAARPSGTRTA